MLMDYMYATGMKNLVGPEEQDFGGFIITRDLLADVPCILSLETGVADTPQLHYLCYENHYCNVAVNAAPLSKRIWGFQKRLLSRRAVPFGYQFHRNVHRCGLASASQPDMTVHALGLKALNTSRTPYKPFGLSCCSPQATRLR